MSNLKKIYFQQRFALPFIYGKGKYGHTREFFRSNNILNVYQLNILNNVMFSHKIIISTTPNVYLSKFQKPSHFNPILFSIVKFLKLT